MERPRFIYISGLLKKEKIKKSLKLKLYNLPHVKKFLSMGLWCRNNLIFHGAKNTNSWHTMVKNLPTVVKLYELPVCMYK